MFTADCIVTSAGGVEEDFIKCLAPTYLGQFELKGSDLGSRGINRIGNLLVPNKNYCLFERWMTPILDQMLCEQKEKVFKNKYDKTSGKIWMDLAVTFAKTHISV